MQQFVKFVHHFLVRNCVTLFWFVQEVSGYGIMALFGRCAAIRRTRHIFMAKGAVIQGLWRFTRRRAHCGAAIKVRHFWWEKSGARAAMFSSAAATCLLQFFLTLTVGAVLHW